MKGRMDTRHRIPCSPGGGPAAGVGRLDRDEKAVRRRCAAWLRRVLAAWPQLDHPTLELTGTLLGAGVTPVNRVLVAAMPEDMRVGARAGLAECRFVPTRWPYEVVDLLKHCPRRAERQVADAVLAALDRLERRLAAAGAGVLERRAAEVARMLALDDDERELLTFLVILSTWPPAESYFEDHLQCQALTNRKYLRTMLAVPPGRLERLLHGTLDRLGALPRNGPWFRLADEFLELFQGSGGPASDSLFARLPRATLALDRHLVPDDQVDHLRQLLARRPAQAVHVLLYGPPGTGKSSFARALARELKVPAYAVLTAADNTAARRRTAVQACLNLTNQGEGSLVVVDEADHLLNTLHAFAERGETQDKGWLNHLLEQPGVRMIWIVNALDGVEASVRRRFTFSVAFPEFTRAQRIQVWRTVLQSAGARGAFDGAEIARLAARYRCSAGPVELAVRQAREVAAPGTEAFRTAVRLALDAHHAMANGGRPPEEPEAAAREYAVAGLNVSPELGPLRAALEGFGRDGASGAPLPNLNALFHGPPGTGKSELARHLARLRDREMLYRQADELMGPYVGETEARIRDAFRTAERDGAVLVIDEVDTFLFPRGRAQRSWEISFTNAFLTAMERYRGILLCTTNRLAGMDSACLRRFQFKVRLDWLTPEGAEIFFRRLLAPLAGAALDPDAAAALRRLAGLAPGDFRAVHDRFVMLPRGAVTPAQLVEALAEERRLKDRSAAGERSIGFVPAAPPESRARAVPLTGVGIPSAPLHPAGDDAPAGPAPRPSPCRRRPR